MNMEMIASYCKKHKEHMNRYRAWAKYRGVPFKLAVRITIKR